MSLQKRLNKFPKIALVTYPTPIERLNGISKYLGRDIYIKRDDLTPIAFGGNKLRKLEFLAADALNQGADSFVTGGAVQSNHVRQSAAVAAKLSLGFYALLENLINTKDKNYLTNSNRLLLDLFNAHVEEVEELNDPKAQLQEFADRLTVKKPYIIPIGGSNALGALGYVQASLEIANQIKDTGVNFAYILTASGSGGTHAGLAAGLFHVLKSIKLIGVSVSRKADEQMQKVASLVADIDNLLGIKTDANINIWDEYFPPRYGEPNEKCLEAVKLFAELDGVLLDPVYTGKAAAGLIDGVKKRRFSDNGAILFIHTGGASALFAYHKL
ncbi:MAG: D-cysteine desulfhydrase [Campylobacteraceae bacterium]|jgi:D-cysteine desulfhydrase|nr:D-cysteine desulfhydrase [Campylobacteraceae bacterium]